MVFLCYVHHSISFKIVLSDLIKNIYVYIIYIEINLYINEYTKKKAKHTNTENLDLMLFSLKELKKQSQLFSQLRNYPIKQIMYTILNKSMKA